MNESSHNDTAKYASQGDDLLTQKKKSIHSIIIITIII